MGRLQPVYLSGFSLKSTKKYSKDLTVFCDQAVACKGYNSSSQAVKYFLEEFLSHPGVGFNGGRVTKKCDTRTLKILFRTGGLHRASTNGLKLVSV